MHRETELEFIVVTYHYLGADDRYPYSGISGIAPDAFAAQIASLGRRLEFVSLDDVSRAVSGAKTLPQKACLVSFDDGLREQFEVGWPILRDQGIPAAFFVPGLPLTGRPLEVQLTHYLRAVMSPEVFWREIADRLDREGVGSFQDVPAARAMAHYRYDDEETARRKYHLNYLTPSEARARVLEGLFCTVRDPADFCRAMYMGRDELTELARDGAAIGLHSHLHVPMAQLSQSELQQDLQLNAAALTASFESTCEPIAISYPFGGPDAVSAQVESAARGAGLRIGFTTERAVNVTLERPLLFARFDANDIPGGRRPLMEWTDHEMVVAPGVGKRRELFFEERSGAPGASASSA